MAYTKLFMLTPDIAARVRRELELAIIQLKRRERGDETFDAQEEALRIIEGAATMLKYHTR